MSNKYWAERVAKAQTALTEKNIKQIEKQMAKYYKKSMDKVINDFENVYNKVLAQAADGGQVSPALLYRLDSYWQMQGQLRRELESLGAKQLATMSKIFEINFFEVYYSLEIEGAAAFSTISKENARQLINSIWCVDGKSYSQRVWENTELLANTLNEELIHSVITGKKTTDLKQLLQDRFAVSYSRADALVRTEMAHIQTEAAKRRYEDYGLQEVEVWADEDERRCDVCGKLHQKRYPIGAQVPIPAHPRCRCCIIPVVE